MKHYIYISVCVVTPAELGYRIRKILIIMNTPKFFSLILIFSSSLLVFQVLEARMLFPYLPPSYGNGFGGNNNQEDNGQGKGGIARSASNHAGSETDGGSPPSGTVETTPPSNGGTKMTSQNATNDGNGVQRVVNTGSGSQTAENSGNGVQDVENNGHGAQHANNNGNGVQQVVNNGGGIQNANNEGNGVQQMVNNPTDSVNNNVDQNGGVKRVVDEGGQTVTQQVNGDGTVQVVTKDKDGQTHTTSVGPNGINYGGNYYGDGNGFGGNDNQEDNGQDKGGIKDDPTSGYVNTTVDQRDVDERGKLVTEQANGHRAEVVTKTHTTSVGPNGINYDGSGVQRVVSTGSGSQTQTAKNSLKGVQDVENNGHGTQHTNNEGSGVQQVINNGDGVQNANNKGNGVQQVVNGDPTDSVNSNVDQRVVDEGGNSVMEQANDNGVKVVTKTHTTSVGPNEINYDSNYGGPKSSPSFSGSNANNNP